MLEKCESFFTNKLASFLCEAPKEDEIRALARASVMESQSIIYKEKSFGDFVENMVGKSEGLIQSAAAPPTRLLVGSALVPAGGGQLKNGQLAGTFSGPVGRGGSFQSPFTGALHGSLRVPSHGSYAASPLQASRELDESQKEEMRKQFTDSVKQLLNGQEQNNFVQRAHSAMVPAGEKHNPLMETSILNVQKLKMHLGNNNATMVPVLQMQQGFGVASRQTTGGDASQRERSPLSLANIAEGRAVSLSSKMPLMTNRGAPGAVRQTSRQFGI